jgi:S-formylglutathione hydrolase FrmB
VSLSSRLARFSAVAALATLAFASTAVAAPTFTSSNGITVTSQSKLQDQLYDLQVSTPAISPKATAKGNGIRVILPRNYETSGAKRYPVIYLLHGFSLSYNIWTDWTKPGTMQSLVGDDEVILVMPDGGKGGWYTDWLNQSIAQKWETYHLQQLVPFIDANLRTINDRTGRAVAGYSMGGLGAMRYAEDRPDLFGTVTSMSGALNLRDPAIVTAVAASAFYGLPWLGAYGSPMWPFDGRWRSATPYAHPAALANTNVFLSAAQESPTVPPSTQNLIEQAGMQLVEGVVRNATLGFTKVLKGAGVDYDYLAVGAPGAFQYGYCDGGHNVGCGAYAMMKLIPKMVSVMAPAR